jgi:hypothetical protein
MRQSLGWAGITPARSGQNRLAALKTWVLNVRIAMRMTRGRGRRDHGVGQVKGTISSPVGR